MGFIKIITKGCLQKLLLYIAVSEKEEVVYEKIKLDIFRLKAKVNTNTFSIVQ